MRLRRFLWVQNGVLLDSDKFRDQFRSILQRHFGAGCNPRTWRQVATSISREYILPHLLEPGETTSSDWASGHSSPISRAHYSRNGDDIPRLTIDAVLELRSADHAWHDTLGVGKNPPPPPVRFLGKSTKSGVSSEDIQTIVRLAIQEALSAHGLAAEGLSGGQIVPQGSKALAASTHQGSKALAASTLQGSKVLPASTSEGLGIVPPPAPQGPAALPASTPEGLAVAPAPVFQGPVVLPSSTPKGGAVSPAPAPSTPPAPPCGQSVSDIHPSHSAQRNSSPAEPLPPMSSFRFDMEHEIAEDIALSEANESQDAPAPQEDDDNPAPSSCGPRQLGKRKRPSLVVDDDEDDDEVEIVDENDSSRRSERSQELVERRASSILHHYPSSMADFIVSDHQSSPTSEPSSLPPCNKQSYKHAANIGNILVEATPDNTPSSSEIAWNFWAEKAKEGLRKLFKNPAADFKSESQKALIVHILSDSADIYAVVPTGGGKTQSWQATAVVQPEYRGLIVVPFVFPLEDHVKDNIAKGIPSCKWKPGTLPPPDCIHIFLQPEHYITEEFQT